ncbi:tannase and feruloyl esterase [Durotheca rogersii]|uniref:tannase and feruloyl esterase n=1 Tax=Durotheca rogersii TaxID=419775 RepID=UPI00221EA6C7|nr:tannase and feruloyl esterase [Durotheca rogersii]KAI5861920.1 tannase and feruloyl esterase [Durotheca rogersii]
MRKYEAYIFKRWASPLLQHTLVTRYLVNSESVLIMRLHNSPVSLLSLAFVYQRAYASPLAPPECSLENLRNLLSAADGPVARNATVLSVTAVPANGAYGDRDVYPDTPQMFATGLPELCAVEVNVTSSESSAYTFALFLPTEWESRFLAVGGGGTAGYINFLDMAVGSHQGFATMSTDNGHRGGVFDVEWMLNAPQKQIDWGWRAMHGSVGLAKQLVQGYYGGAGIRYSYYTGCSNGGRQGLKEAQVDAESFDGLLIGAPAWWISHMVSWDTKISKDFYPASDPKSIPPALFSLVAATVIEQCDGADGVEDGIISSPERCHADLGVLSCDLVSANATAACLTPVQLQTLQRIYADYYVGSEMAHPGLELSSEAGWSDPLFTGGEPLAYGLGILRYGVFGDPNWPLDAYNDSVYAYVRDFPLMRQLDADAFDMSPVRDRGAKILMYHGLADPLLVTRGSTHFYEQVARATSGGAANATTPASMDDWFRLLLVPGLQHCVGTPPGVNAPWNFNGAAQATVLGPGEWSVPGFHDADHDALLALVRWVEDATPVDRLVATTWRDAEAPDSGVARQRPLCPHPQKAVYDGVGDVDEASSWRCA